MTTKKLIEKTWQQARAEGFEFVVQPSLKILAVERRGNTVFNSPRFAYHYHDIATLSEESGATMEECFGYLYRIGNIR